jgi:hypothetical protein
LDPLSTAEERRRSNDLGGGQTARSYFPPKEKETAKKCAGDSRFPASRLSPQLSNIITVLWIQSFILSHFGRGCVHEPSTFLRFTLRRIKHEVWHEYCDAKTQLLLLACHDEEEYTPEEKEAVKLCH